MKDTNPKDAVGVRKTPITVIPGPVIGELGVALLEGARKYGRHNWRVASARASVYIDAVWRHLTAWWEGEDIDPDSDLSHITKAIASLTVMRDAMIQEKFVDDRPPKSPASWLKELNQRASNIIDRHPVAKSIFAASSKQLCSSPTCKRHVPHELGSCYDIATNPVVSSVDACQVDHCGRLQTAESGYCDLHQAASEERVGSSSLIQICEVSSCTNSATWEGLCPMHHSQKYHRSEPTDE